MTKVKLILMAIRIVMVCIALGVGIWYLSSSLGGSSMSYTSMDSFISAIGAKDGDISTANGCFMCTYIADLFFIIGDATERFWKLMVDNIWILMAVGFGIFILIHTISYIWEKTKRSALARNPQISPFVFKDWFDRIWKLGVRIMVAGALMGTLGLGGTTALKSISTVTITPVLFVGAQLGMAASGVSDAAQCGALNTNIKGDASDILNPIMQPFMCVMGNINAVMLAGAAGGFTLMNYSWMGMGGGVFTWVAGLALVLMFLVIGFDLFFQILSVVFKLVFIIIFLPLLLAAAAFEQVWSRAKGVMQGALEMLVSSAVRLVAITLKVLLIYGTVAYVADMNFPGPVDGFSSVLPPMMGMHAENPDAKTLAVMNVFKTCEEVGLEDGEMDADKFKDCFTAQKAEVERQYPGAFDYLDDGWNFLLMMIFLFFLYYYTIGPKIDKLLPAGNIKLPIPGKGADVSSGEFFDIGSNIHNLGQKIYNVPNQIAEKVAKAAEKEK